MQSKSVERRMKAQRGDLLEVKMDQSGRLANEYVDILQEIRELDEKKDHKGAELVEALRGQGRAGITVRGYTLKIKEVEAKVKIADQRQGAE